MSKKDETLEMARLYQSGMKLREIGNQFGVSRQYVQQRLSSIGITGDARPAPFMLIDKELLASLYAEKLPLQKIAEAFGVNIPLISQALVFHRIPKRGWINTSGCRVDTLRKLKVGDSSEAEFNRKRPYGGIYAAAKKLGIKVSVRFLGDNKYEVTRIA